jgi:hypothetical protein
LQNTALGQMYLYPTNANEVVIGQTTNSIHGLSGFTLIVNGTSALGGDVVLGISGTDLSPLNVYGSTGTGNVYLQTNNTTNVGGIGIENAGGQIVTGSALGDMSYWTTSNMNFGPGGGNTLLFKMTSGGTFNIQAPLSNSYNGTSGTVYVGEPFAGTYYKKIVIFLNGFYKSLSQAIVWPVAFTNTPVLVVQATGITVSTITTTGANIVVGGTVTGFAIVEGY